MTVDNKDNRRNTMDSTNSSSSSKSTSSRTSTKIKSTLVRLSGIFSRSTTSSTLLSSAPSNTFTTTNRRSSSSSSNSSVNTTPSSVTSLDITSPTTHGRKKKWIDRDSAISNITIPPFSPTYCKPNEFPYSNFYMKLPNGKWMIRYRSGSRDIIGTDEFAGYMI